MKPKARRIAFLVLGVLFLGTNAFARPAYLKQYKTYYKGSRATCNTCHTARPKLNAYGASLQKALNGGRMLTPAMFKASEANRPHP